MVKTPYCVETREGGVGWVEMPPSHISTRGGHWGVVETPLSRQNTRGRCGVPLSHVSMRGGCWGVVETPPSRRNTRGRCRVGRNAPVLRFDARRALGSGRKVMVIAINNVVCCWWWPSPFRLWRLVRTGFSWSSKFCNNERPKTRPWLWSFPVLGISGPDPVQSRFFCSPKTGLTSTIHTWHEL